MPNVYTLGYAAPGAAEKLDQLMTDPAMTLLDIRLRPVSRWYPAFCKASLERRFSWQYFDVPELGNLNYRDRSLPIVLARSSEGLEFVLGLLRFDRPVCLLCACKDVESCHRSFVARLVQEQFSCEVVHL